MKNSFRLKARMTAASMAMLCGPVSATVQFIRLGGVVEGGESWNTRLSADGAAAAGRVNLEAGTAQYVNGYHWDAATGMKAFGPPASQTSGSWGNDISGNGRVVVGSLYPELSVANAYRWTQAGGMVPLGDFAGGQEWSEAYGASWDGSVIVGYGTESHPTDIRRHAFKWTEATGMTALAEPADSNYSVARAVSRDGGIIVGAIGHGDDVLAAMWTPSSVVVLGDLPGDYVYSEALAVSADGGTAVGWGVSAYGSEAFRWTAETGLVPLGSPEGPPGSSRVSRAMGVSGDGEIVVGFGFSSTGNQEALVWDGVNGMRNLDSILRENGMDTTGLTFLEASDISDDGTAIAGILRSGPGMWESFIVSGLTIIPEPSSTGLVGLALGAVAMRRRRGRA